MSIKRTSRSGRPTAGGYVHGYDPREAIRLLDQAGTLADLLHSDTAYPEGSTVLEAGCGVGAQTVTLARNSPDARIVSVDISAESLEAAKTAVAKAGIANVEFLEADILSLPFEPESFDHVFVCFVLEHLPQPADVLRALREVLKPRGTITVIEGDHGSTFFHPDCDKARGVIRRLVDLQRAAGGNANIGRELYPLLTGAGFEAVRVSPRMVYVDASKPQLVEGFTKKTFTAMIEGVREPVIEAGLMKAAEFDAGVRGLHRAAEDDGVFCYTFFKGIGLKPGKSGAESQRRSP